MILRGQAFWPKVFEGSLTGDEKKYQVDICHLDEDTIKQLEDSGLTVKKDSKRIRPLNSEVDRLLASSNRAKKMGRFILYT